MKKYILIALILVLAGTAAAIAAPDEAALKAKETAAWQAFKDKKADDFKKVLGGTDMVGVSAYGFNDLQKEIADMPKWDMKSFAISDFKVTMSGSDVAITTYTVKVEGSADGQDMSGTYNAASVWKEKDGQWQGIFHTEMKQEGPAK